MISDEEMKKAIDEGGTVLISKNRLIKNVQEISTRPAETSKPNNSSSDLTEIMSELATVKQNQSDVKKLSSVQNILSFYDREIDDIYSNISINDLTIQFENKLAA